MCVNKVRLLYGSIQEFVAVSMGLRVVDGARETRDLDVGRWELYALFRSPGISGGEPHKRSGPCGLVLCVSGLLPNRPGIIRGRYSRDLLPLRPIYSYKTCPSTTNQSIFSLLVSHSLRTHPSHPPWIPVRLRLLRYLRLSLVVLLWKKKVFLKKSIRKLAGSHSSLNTLHHGN